ncbi:MAG: carbohydrate ABC transporter permease [Ruthenibacterium sp.]
MKSQRILGAKTTKRLLDVLCHIIMILMTIFMLFPVYWAFLTSIKPDELIYKFPPVFMTDQFTWDQYKFAFGSQNIFRFMLNTLTFSALAAIISVMLALFAAYALSRLPLKNKNWIMGFFLVPMLIPGITNLIPLYSVYSKVGMIDTYVGMILLYLPGLLPLAVVVLRNYFDGIPVALEEAAMIDGCNRVNVVWKIILPIVGSGIVAVFIINFVAVWNEFLVTLIFTSKSEMRTLTVGIYNLIGVSKVHQGAINAVGLLSVLPVLTLFLIFRKKFIATMMDGAIKG